MEKKPDIVKMENALNKCIQLFGRLKKKSIDKKNYERAAKIRGYERMCKNALYNKSNDDEYLSIIVSKSGTSVTVSANDLISRLGLLGLADHNIHVMINDVINYFEMNKKAPHEN